MRIEGIAIPLPGPNDAAPRFTPFAFIGSPNPRGRLEAKLLFRDTDGCRMLDLKGDAPTTIYRCTDYAEREGVPTCTIHDYGLGGDIRFSGGPKPVFGLNPLPQTVLVYDDFDISRADIVPLSTHVSSELMATLVELIDGIVNATDLSDDEALLQSGDIIAGFEALDGSRSEQAADSVPVPLWCLRMMRNRIVDDQDWSDDVSAMYRMLLDLQPLFWAAGQKVKFV